MSVLSLLDAGKVVIFVFLRNIVSQTCPRCLSSSEVSRCSKDCNLLIPSQKKSIYSSYVIYKDFSACSGLKTQNLTGTRVEQYFWNCFSSKFSSQVRFYRSGPKNSCSPLYATKHKCVKKNGVSNNEDISFTKERGLSEQQLNSEMRKIAFKIKKDQWVKKASNTKSVSTDSISINKDSPILTQTSKSIGYNQRGNSNYVIFESKSLKELKRQINENKQKSASHSKLSLSRQPPTVLFDAKKIIATKKIDNNTSQDPTSLPSPYFFVQGSLSKKASLKGTFTPSFLEAGSKDKTKLEKPHENKNEVGSSPCPRLFEKDEVNNSSVDLSTVQRNMDYLAAKVVPRPQQILQKMSQIQHGTKSFTAPQQKKVDYPCPKLTNSDILSSKQFFNSSNQVRPCSNCLTTSGKTDEEVVTNTKEKRVNKNRVDFYDIYYSYDESLRKSGKEMRRQFRMKHQSSNEIDSKTMSSSVVQDTNTPKSGNNSAMDSMIKDLSITNKSKTLSNEVHKSHLSSWSKCRHHSGELRSKKRYVENNSTSSSSVSHQTRKFSVGNELRTACTINIHELTGENDGGKTLEFKNSIKPLALVVNPKDVNKNCAEGDTTSISDNSCRNDINVKDDIKDINDSLSIEFSCSEVKNVDIESSSMLMDSSAEAEKFIRDPYLESNIQTNCIKSKSIKSANDNTTTFSGNETDSFHLADESSILKLHSSSIDNSDLVKSNSNSEKNTEGGEEFSNLFFKSPKKCDVPKEVNFCEFRQRSFSTETRNSEKPSFRTLQSKGKLKHISFKPLPSNENMKNTIDDENQSKAQEGADQTTENNISFVNDNPRRHFTAIKSLVKEELDFRRNEIDETCQTLKRNLSTADHLVSSNNINNNAKKDLEPLKPSLLSYDQSENKLKNEPDVAIILEKPTLKETVESSGIKHTESYIDKKLLSKTEKDVHKKVDDKIATLNTTQIGESQCLSFEAEKTMVEKSGSSVDLAFKIKAFSNDSELIKENSSEESILTSSNKNMILSDQILNNVPSKTSEKKDLNIISTSNKPNEKENLNFGSNLSISSREGILNENTEKIPSPFLLSLKVRPWIENLIQETKKSTDMLNFVKRELDMSLPLKDESPLISDVETNSVNYSQLKNMERESVVSQNNIITEPKESGIHSNSTIIRSKEEDNLKESSTIELKNDEETLNKTDASEVMKAVKSSPKDILDHTSKTNSAESILNDLKFLIKKEILLHDNQLSKCNRSSRSILEEQKEEPSIETSKSVASIDQKISLALSDHENLKNTYYHLQKAKSSIEACLKKIEGNNTASISSYQQPIYNYNYYQKNNSEPEEEKVNVESSTSNLIKVNEEAITKVDRQNMSSSIEKENKSLVFDTGNTDVRIHSTTKEHSVGKYNKVNYDLFNYLNLINSGENGDVLPRRMHESTLVKNKATIESRPENEIMSQGNDCIISSSQKSINNNIDFTVPQNNIVNQKEPNKMTSVLLKNNQDKENSLIKLGTSQTFVLKDYSLNKDVTMITSSLYPSVSDHTKAKNDLDKSGIYKAAPSFMMLDPIFLTNGVSDEPSNNTISNLSIIDANSQKENRLNSSDDHIRHKNSEKELTPSMEHNNPKISSAKENSQSNHQVSIPMYEFKKEPNYDQRNTFVFPSGTIDVVPPDILKNIYTSSVQPDSSIRSENQNEVKCELFDQKKISEKSFGKALEKTSENMVKDTTSIPNNFECQLFNQKKITVTNPTQRAVVSSSIESQVMPTTSNYQTITKNNENKKKVSFFNEHNIFPLVTGNIDIIPLELVKNPVSNSKTITASNVETDQTGVKLQVDAPKASSDLAPDTISHRSSHIQPSVDYGKKISDFLDQQILLSEASGVVNSSTSREDKNIFQPSTPSVPISENEVHKQIDVVSAPDIPNSSYVKADAEAPENKIDFAEHSMYAFASGSGTADTMPPNTIEKFKVEELPEANLNPLYTYLNSFQHTSADANSNNVEIETEREDKLPQFRHLKSLGLSNVVPRSNKKDSKSNPTEYVLNPLHDVFKSRTSSVKSSYPKLNPDSDIYQNKVQKDLLRESEKKFKTSVISQTNVKENHKFEDTATQMTAEQNEKINHTLFEKPKNVKSPSSATFENQIAAAAKKSNKNNISVSNRSSLVKLQDNVSSVPENSSWTPLSTRAERKYNISDLSKNLSSYFHKLVSWKSNLPEMSGSEINRCLPVNNKTGDEIKTGASCQDCGDTKKSVNPLLDVFHRKLDESVDILMKSPIKSISKAALSIKANSPPPGILPPPCKFFSKDNKTKSMFSSIAKGIKMSRSKSTSSFKKGYIAPNTNETEGNEVGKSSSNGSVASYYSTWSKSKCDSEENLQESKQLTKYFSSISLDPFEERRWKHEFLRKSSNLKNKISTSKKQFTSVSDSCLDSQRNKKSPGRTHSYRPLVKRRQIDNSLTRNPYKSLSDIRS